MFANFTTAAGRIKLAGPSGRGCLKGIEHTFVDYVLPRTESPGKGSIRATQRRDACAYQSPELAQTQAPQGHRLVPDAHGQPAAPRRRGLAVLAENDADGLGRHVREPGTGHDTSVVEPPIRARSGSRTVALPATLKDVGHDARRLSRDSGGR